jgi:hypothetical protein
MTVRMTYFKISLIFLNLTFPFAAHTSIVYLPIFSSAAEPHHIDAALAPCINLDAVPILVLSFLYCTVHCSVQ